MSEEMNKLEYKLRKLIWWKLTWTFKSFFKWDWMEISDFRKYEEWDDYKSINWKLTAKHNWLFVNVFRQEKDLNIDIFFDINWNWLWWEDIVNVDSVTDKFIDIFILAKKYWAKINTFSYDFKSKLIIKNQIWNNKLLAYGEILKLKSQLKKSPKRYISNLDSFLNIQKTITRKRVIIIFSDFLILENDIVNKIKYLWKNNTLFISKVNIGQIVWFNYNKLTLNKKLIDSDSLNIYYL